MENKLDTRWYNLDEIDAADDIQYSTDFTEEADDLVYKRYKLQLFDIGQSVTQYHELID